MLFQLILFSFCILGNCLDSIQYNSIPQPIECYFPLLLDDQVVLLSNTSLTLPNYHNDSGDTCICPCQLNQNDKNIFISMKPVGIFLLTTVLLLGFVNIIGDMFISLVVMGGLLLLLLIFIVAN